MGMSFLNSWTLSLVCAILKLPTCLHEGVGMFCCSPCFCKEEKVSTDHLASFTRSMDDLICPTSPAACAEVSVQRFFSFSKRRMSFLLAYFARLYAMLVPMHLPPIIIISAWCCCCEEKSCFWVC